MKWSVHYTVEAVYNDIGLCDTSPITSDILWQPLHSSPLP